MGRPYKPNKAANEEWGTPDSLFDPLDREFGFNLDAAASADNALCDRFYTAEQDGTQHPWEPGPVFCNPPFNYKALRAFTEKALWEAADNGVTTVLVVPAKTDQPWWHWLWGGRNGPDVCVEFRFVKGRVKFVGGRHRSPDPTVVIVVRPERRGKGA